MEEGISSNKRLAKNTIILYVRMLFSSLVGLYASRIVLSVLGVEDFGIYGVVGGIVVLFGFITASLGGTTSRFLTYELGKGDIEKLKELFNCIMLIHVLMAIGIVLLAETAGLFFIFSKLQISPERMNAALWVYHISVFSAALGFIATPMSACIIAHEKMNCIAYVSMAEAVLRLLFVFLLTVVSFDKLVAHSFFVLLISVTTIIMSIWYCRKNFDECRFQFVWNKPLTKEIFSYAGWTMGGNLAVVGYTQGLNVVLNLFFGTTVNAARSIAVQVQGIVQSFCANFQMALNPQLTKSYAGGNIGDMHRLLILSSKFSYFLLLSIILPILFEAPFVLNLWLGIVPDHTVNFLRIILLTGLLQALSNPIIIAVHATGKIVRFQAIEGTLLLLIVPVAYILLKTHGFPPEIVFVVHFCIEACTQYARLRIVLPIIGMKQKEYMKNVMYPILKVSLFAPLLPLLLFRFLPEMSFTGFFMTGLTGLLSVLSLVYCSGCTPTERAFIHRKIATFIMKNRNSQKRN